MADNKPTTWSISKNPPISNHGTIADKRLTTISPTNPTGYIPLNPNSTDPIVKNTSIAIDTNGNVRYLWNNNGNKEYYNNIQDYANNILGYDPATTARLKDATQSTLTQRTKDIIIDQKTPASPYAKVDPNTSAGQQGQTTVEELTGGIKTNEDKIRKIGRAHV